MPVCMCPQNDASKNEANKDMQRLKKQVDYWKEQAGIPAEVRGWKKAGMSA